MAVSSLRYYVGLMSGTSLDGVDAVLARFGRRRPELLQSCYLPYPPELRAECLNLSSAGPDELHRAAHCANRLAKQYAAAVQKLLTQAGISAERVAAIGCHGQTVRHRPERGYTLQLGNLALLAELSGITVVGDFRSRDVAAGGQGAPLVPAFHRAVFHNPRLDRVVVNIGGIANLTHIPARGPVTGFDCGPGNLLLDAWAARHLGRPMDENGAWAAGGRVDPDTLDRLLEHEFFPLPPPKSAGRENFPLSWVEACMTGNPSPQDVQATLAALTVRGIAEAIKRHCAESRELLLCGGGARNPVLVARLRESLAGCRVDATDAFGMDADFVEAMAFAWLAWRTRSGLPGNLPDVTGAAGERILGAVYPA